MAVQKTPHTSCQKMGHLPPNLKLTTSTSTGMSSTPAVQKFCFTCGRIISRAKSSDANFSTQKYCSHSCRTRKPGELDRRIESVFLSLLTPPNTHDRKKGVTCTEVQASVFASKETHTPASPAAPAPAPPATPASPAAVGMEIAEQRERVRRAGRRLVVFPDSAESEIGARLECVQNGKVVEGSFAKGDWGIRRAE